MKPIYAKMEEEGSTVPSDVFFMKQKISNACGTFALIHSLANNRSKIDLGKFIYFEFVEYYVNSVFSF